MKKLTAFFLIVSCTFLLTACGCKHEWQEATCETPKTCTLCKETEGDPLDHSWMDAACETAKTCVVCGATEGNALGHDWADADCDMAKTCARCGSSEGEALGHSWTEATCQAPKACSVCDLTEGDPSGHAYSTWEAGEETMTRHCADCGIEESQPTDWNVFLQDLLADRWICTEVESLNGKLDMYVYFPQTPFLEITEDQSIRFFNGTASNYGTAEYVHRMEKDGIRSDVFKVLEDGEPRFIFSHRVPVDSSELGEQIYGNAGLGTFKFERESEEDARMRQSLIGIWNSDKAEYSSVTFRDDYSLTIEINGESVEATWSPSSYNEYETEISCSYYLRYLKDNRWEQFLATLSLYPDGKAPSLRIMFDSESVYYTAE